MPESIDPQLVLRHTQWLRRLATGLVGEGPDAEDLIQETWLAAVRRPPRALGQTPEEAGLRSWLASVLRNRARVRLRSSNRRSWLERELERDGDEPSVAESVERASVQRELMDAVLGLQESWRDVVILRYFDDLPPREIGRRLGVPANVVRSRLHRALEALRARLDRAHGGDRRSWCVALAPLLAAEEVGGNLGLGALLMKTQTKVLAGTLVAMGLLAVTGGRLLSTRSAEGAASLAEVRTPTPPLAEAPPPATAAVGEPESGERTPAAVPTVEPAAAAPLLLEGRVRDVTGRGVADLAVAFAEVGGALAATGAVTAADGSFSLPHPGSAGRLEVLADEWFTLLGEDVGAAAPERALELVVGPAHRYAGVVSDESGWPVELAEVVVSPDLSLLAALRPGVQRSRTPRWSTSTDEDGRFELPVVGWLEGTNLSVRKHGFRREVRPLPDESRTDLEVLLRPLASKDAALSGQVLLPSGAPAAEAWVLVGGGSTRADSQGRFSIGREAGDDEVVAAMRGYLPVRRALGADVTELVLTLGSPALEIIGRVLGEDGSPVEGAKVWTWDETKVGFRVEDSDSLEDFVGFAGDAASSSRHQHTNAAGAFRLTGLLERGYVVHALNPTTGELLTASSEAGAELTLRFTGGEACRRVAGRVVSMRGEPIEGMRMLFGRDAVDGQPVRTPWVHDPVPRTDAEGRFEFASLATAGTWIRPSGAHASGRKCRLDELPDLESVEIRIPVNCQVQLLLEQGAPLIDRARFVDGDGEPVFWSADLGQVGGQQGYVGVSGRGPFRLTEGRSEILTVPETATTLVLLAGAEEVRRVPLDLRPDEVCFVRR